MKEAYRILPVYAGDVSGIASALYELGGMVVIHDPSGCNSTYNTHDEIRWYDQESYIFLSGLNMRDAVLGNDRKFIDDIVDAFCQLDPKPRFIAICNSPVPYLNGTDFKAICRIVERRCKVRTFYVQSNGMYDYVRGAGLALLEYAKNMLPEKQGSPEAHSGGQISGTLIRRKPGKADGQVPDALGQAAEWVLQAEKQPTGGESVTAEDAAEERRSVRINVLGATPLTYGNIHAVPHLRKILEEGGFQVQSVWAMGSRPEELDTSTDADVNLVISDTGILAAEYFLEQYGIPYVAGVPVSEKAWAELATTLTLAAHGHPADPTHASAAHGHPADTTLTLAAHGHPADTTHASAAQSRPADPTHMETAQAEGEKNRRPGRVKVFIGEAVLMCALAADCEEKAYVLCPFGESWEFCRKAQENAQSFMGYPERPDNLKKTDGSGKSDEDFRFFDGEEQLQQALDLIRDENPEAQIEVWADPMYRLVIGGQFAFHSMPTLALSGRMYQAEYPDFFGWKAGTYFLVCR